MCIKVREVGDRSCFVRLIKHQEPTLRPAMMSLSNSNMYPSIPPSSKAKSKSTDPFPVVPVFHESTHMRRNVNTTR